MNASQPLPTKGRVVSQFLETDPLQHTYGVPTLYMPDQRLVEIHSRNGRRPSRHCRSMSHPFPSIFHGKKKDDVGNMAMEYDAGNMDTFSALTSHGLLKPRASEAAKVQGRDLTTGKCMTCDSMVRWPKELAVFRCSVCVTINDLTPISTIRGPASKYCGHSTRESTRSHTSSTYRGRPAYSYWQFQVYYI
jgi:E3 ubiquitin-protein ligase HECTD2